MQFEIVTDPVNRKQGDLKIKNTIFKYMRDIKQKKRYLHISSDDKIQWR